MTSPSAPFPIRVLSAEQWDVFYETLMTGFGAVPPAEERELDRSLTEFDRTLAAWDGEVIAGTTGAFSFRMTVPGQRVVPAAGVTMVSVRPTYRRRGVLRSLMARQLVDVRERGETLTVLLASEGAIYGRFGYGLATQSLAMSIPRRLVTLRHAEITDGDRIGRFSLRQVDPRETVDVRERVYADAVQRRAGMLERQPGWEYEPLLDPAEKRHGYQPLQCVLLEDTATGAGAHSEVVGYALYSVQAASDEEGPAGTLRVSDVYATDPAGYAELWRYLLGMDLCRTVVAPMRPVDEPMLHLLSDVRPCQLRVRDEGYVRLVDVAGALQQRRYSTQVDLVFNVHDAFCPWNAGRWRLTGGPDGAVCERSTDPADLELTTRELSAAYLGGVSLRSLADAGRVRELRDGALARASSAFFHDGRAPWLPHHF